NSVRDGPCFRTGLIIPLPKFSKKVFAIFANTARKSQFGFSVRWIFIFIEQVPLGRFYSSRPSLRSRRDRVWMNAPVFLAAAAANSSQAELLYVWEKATPEAKIIILFLLIFSIVAWSVMIAKAVQMRRAKKLNTFFSTEYHTQKGVLDVFD